MIYDSQLAASGGRIYSSQVTPSGAPVLSGVFDIVDNLEGVSYSIDLNALNTGGAVDTWTWMYNTVPPSWLNLDTNTGILTGISAVGSWSGYSVVASNTAGAVKSNNDSVTISAIVGYPNLSGTFDIPDSIEGVTYTIDLNDLNTGSAATLWTWNGTPPPWLTLNASTGIITGVSAIGFWSGYSVVATNDAGFDETNTDSVSVSAAAAPVEPAIALSNLAIVSDNLAKTAGLVASSQVGNMVVDNLQKDSKALVWRGAGLSVSIAATITSANISAVALCITNMTSTATMRVRVYALTGDASPVLDTGSVLCCEYTTIEKIDFTNGSLNSNTFNYGGGTYASVFFDVTAGEKIVIDIVDNDNTAGYIDASSLVIGEYWSPIRNANYGADLSLLDTSKHARNDAGDLTTKRGAIYKRLGFSLGTMQSPDRTALLELLIRNGMSVPLFISFFPGADDVQERQVYQLYGKLMKISAVNRFAAGLDKASVQIEEI